MRKNRVLQIALLLCAQSNTNTALALDLYSLSTSDFEYLADLFKHTTSGQAYFIKAFGSHSNIWKEAINKCGAPIKDQPFYFKVNLTLEPSGKPKLLSFDRPFAGDAKLSQFSQCLGIHLMESNYPPHKFPVYFFQFTAIDKTSETGHTPITKSLTTKSPIAGIWKDAKIGGSVSISGRGETYFCWRRPGMKIIAKGITEKSDKISWGKFYAFSDEGIYDVKADLNRDMGETWEIKEDKETLKITAKDQAERIYTKAAEVDPACD